MAKKTTARKPSSRRKKSTENIDDAEVVESTAATAEGPLDTADTDASEGVGSDTPSEPPDTEGKTSDLTEVTETDAVDASVADVDSLVENEPVESDATTLVLEGQESDTSASVETSTDSDGDAEDAAKPLDAETDHETERSDATDQDASEEQTEPQPEDDTAEDTSSAESPVEEPPMPVSPPPAPEQKKAGAGAMIFGGLLAGAIGFGAAYLADGINPPPVPEPVDLSGIEQTIEAQGQRLEEVAASMSDLDAPTVDTSDLEAGVASVVDSLAALDTRMTALESVSASASDENAAPVAIDPALVEELETLKATVAALQEESDAAKVAAQTEASAALQRAAMTRVQTALDTGAPFDGAIGELQNLGVDVPAPLSDSAAEGVPTLASLQDAFPEAARAALAADRANASENGQTGGVADFFRAQLGARSLVPQEGDSSDAVLSRAEHALREGRLADALAEIGSLPDVSQPAMADWSMIAAVRADALSAAQTLMDSLN